MQGAYGVSRVLQGLCVQLDSDHCRNTLSHRLLQVQPRVTES
jgi:hypothetical protein